MTQRASSTKITGMARPIRVEFENAVYHVTARGNERRDFGEADLLAKRLSAALAYRLIHHPGKLDGVSFV